MVAMLEEERHDELGDGIRAVNRNVGYRDASFACLSNIDDIETGGQDGDDLQIGESAKGLGGEGRLVGQDNLGVLGAIDNFIRGGPIINDEVTKFFYFIPGVVARI